MARKSIASVIRKHDNLLTKDEAYTLSLIIKEANKPQEESNHMFEDFDRAQFRKDMARPKVSIPTWVKKGEEWAGVDGWVIVRSVSFKYVTYSWETGNGGYRRETVKRSHDDFFKYFIKSK